MDGDDVFKLVGLVKQLTELLDKNGQFVTAKLIICILMGAAVGADTKPLEKIVSAWFGEHVDLRQEGGKFIIELGWPEQFDNKNSDSA